MTAAPALTRTLPLSISVVHGAHSGVVQSFTQTLVTIGRGSENDLVFSEDSKISRTHVEIHAQSNSLKVKNVSQKNYILIDGVRLEEKILNRPFTLQIGETVLKVDFPIEPDALAALVLSPQLKVAGQARLNAQVKAQAVAPPFPPAQGSPHAGAGAAQFRHPSNSGSSRTTFYAIIAVVSLLGWWFLSDSDLKRKNEIHVRTEGDVARAIEDSANAVREIKKKQETSGQDSIQYKSAQEHYIKGFRDYRSRQYARAVQSFQASLSFYPNHELAKKYLVQSQRKFEAEVDSNMSLGRKYYQRQNYRLCQASFANVMIMLKDSAKAKYKEAKQLYEECNLRTEGRF